MNIYFTEHLRIDYFWLHEVGFHGQTKLMSNRGLLRLYISSESFKIYKIQHSNLYSENVKKHENVQ